MRRLLHSKKFRANLYKWLFMYIGVMGIFTTVVTYSKYMTRLESSDAARPASFYVGISHVDCSQINESDKTTCESGTFRPTSEIEYTFKVDTSKVEVNTEFLLTLRARDEFKIKKFQNVTAGKEPIILDNAVYTHTDAITVGQINNRLVGKMASSNTSEVIYKVTLQYTGNIKNVDPSYDKIVQIGYTATQQER